MYIFNDSDVSNNNELMEAMDYSKMNDSDETNVTGNNELLVTMNY